MVEEAGIQGEPGEFFETLLGALGDIIMIVESDGTLRWVNDAAEDLLRRKKADWIGRNVFELVHPDDAPYTAEALITVAVRDTIGAPLAVRLEMPDGSYIPVEVVTSNQLDNPAIEGLVVVCRDVSRRGLVGADLRESEARFRGAFEEAGTGMALIRVDGRNLRVNRQLCEMTG